MRHVAIVALTALLPLSAAAQVAPAGWPGLVGKTCNIRLTRGGVEAKFMQDATGPSVQLRTGATRVTKVNFTPPNVISFDAMFNGGMYTFTYDEKSKAWSGMYAGQPAYLMCPP
jgi:hypothetical protein